MRKIVLLLVLVFSVAMVWAENYAINARAEQVERKIVIIYDLSKTVNVRLLMATDMSNDFKELKKVTGHVGKNVPAGTYRTIVWSPLEEFDRFVADGVRFKVETEAISPIPLRVSESQIITTAVGVTKYITVTCDKPWEIQYASATMYSATRSGSSVKVVVSPNTSTSARNDYFYIRTTDESEKVKISLSQSGKSSTASSSSSSHNARNGIQAGHEYVDLGLSVKWATCNVGANRPEEYGDYFAWGETQPKSTYDWLTYKWCTRTYADLTKYCTTTSRRYGIVDNKNILELIDDAARANWGGSWRMPTKAEQDELRNNCTWTWTTQNGVKGYKVTSKSNGNSIFLPATGCRNVTSLNGAGSYGKYWSSSLYTDYPSRAYYLNFGSGYVDWNNDLRSFGFSVRPVCQ